ncbi:uncharacterized protein AB675_9029 [Cyphellophora attinorum]|uniref:Uncharacterized protein n=1 Tax=Cyphellophora attinorum TaxID=1664694 RepID=A0A0N1NZF1_9EURO|nr:uncharacterized protein AB675_9029 [Phialophora attinorum]KPI41467.1 hypothetical protein AB675_9029 [Phialophora attinorum]
MEPMSSEDKTRHENGTIKMLKGGEDYLGAGLRQILKDPQISTVTKCLSAYLDLIEEESEFKWKEIENTSDVFKLLLPVLRQAPQLVELRICDFKRIDPVTKLDLRKSKFDNIKALKLQDVAEAALVISACPKLETLSCTYPTVNVKATMDTILAHPTIVNLELHCKAWTVEQFSKATEYVSSTIEHLSFAGEIKTTITGGLVPALKTLETSNLKKLEVTTNPWVNYKYYEKRWVDDRYLDAIDLAKERSKFNENGMKVTTALFAACESLQTINLAHHHEFKTTKYTVRRDDGKIKVTSEDDVQMPEEYKVFQTYLGDRWRPVVWLPHE